MTIIELIRELVKLPPDAEITEIRNLGTNRAMNLRLVGISDWTDTGYPRHTRPPGRRIVMMLSKPLPRPVAATCSPDPRPKCEACGGAGKHGTHLCRDCDGSGRVGDLCRFCNGKGYPVERPHQKCGRCDGTGIGETHEAP